MLATLPTAMPPVMPADFLPGAEDVRMQVIERQAGETDWPFLADKGRLTCTPSMGFKIVMFLPWVEEEEGGESGFSLEEEGNKPVLVSTDPIQLWTDFEGAAKLQPGMTIEDKIRRMGPYVTLGKKLCDQPEWTNIGPSEL